MGSIAVGFRGAAISVQNDLFGPEDSFTTGKAPFHDPLDSPVEVDVVRVDHLDGFLAFPLKIFAGLCGQHVPPVEELQKLVDEVLEAV